jgi:hypothetical protein
MPATEGCVLRCAQSAYLAPLWTLNGMRRQSVRTAVRHLEHLFGATPATVQEAIEGMELSNLEDLAIAVLDFNQLLDVESWIRRHQTNPPPRR